MFDAYMGDIHVNEIQLYYIMSIGRSAILMHITTECDEVSDYCNKHFSCCCNNLLCFIVISPDQS